jgi:formyl-CoA transferase
MPGPLSHIRVLDLSRVLAGPWCGQTLADLGAEVIKVERPGRGDDTRAWGPPYLKDEHGRDTSEAAYYLSANRGKKSITIDLAHPDGQHLVGELAKHCDVVLENYKVGDMARYGLAYEALRALNPRLVYCSITGFGQTGPYAQRAGYDFIIQGMGGLMSITGERDELPGGGPQKVGVAVSDLMTGMYATVAVLAALAHRDRTGEGQYIDLALLDVQVAMLANVAANYLTSGVPPKRWGNAHANIVPYQSFATADGHIIVAVGNDDQYAKFCAIGGRIDLAHDERFVRNEGRVRHRDTLIPMLAEMMRTKACAFWLDALESAGVPCGPVNTLDRVFTDPQVVARNLRMELPHPLAGSVPLVASPMFFSSTPIEYDRPPPTLGEHTDAVLRDVLGYDDQAIAQLAMALGRRRDEG